MIQSSNRYAFVNLRPVVWLSVSTWNSSDFRILAKRPYDQLTRRKNGWNGIRFLRTATRKLDLSGGPWAIQTVPPILVRTKLKLYPLYGDPIRKSARSFREVSPKWRKIRRCWEPNTQSAHRFAADTAGPTFHASYIICNGMRSPVGCTSHSINLRCACWSKKSAVAASCGCELTLLLKENISEQITLHCSPLRNWSPCIRRHYDPRSSSASCFIRRNQAP